MNCFYFGVITKLLMFALLTVLMGPVKAGDLPDPRTCGSQDRGNLPCEVAKLQERQARQDQLNAQQSEQIRRMQQQIDQLMGKVNQLQSRGH